MLAGVAFCYSTTNKVNKMNKALHPDVTMTSSEMTQGVISTIIMFRSRGSGLGSRCGLSSGIVLNDASVILKYIHDGLKLSDAEWLLDWVTTYMPSKTSTYKGACAYEGMDYGDTYTDRNGVERIA